MKLLTCILLNAGIYFNTLSQTKENLISDGKKEFASGNYFLSVQLFDKALKLDPNLEEINFLAGLAEYNLKNFNKAESYCSAEIRNNNDFAKAYILRAKANRHSFDEALSDFQKAQELVPNDPEVFLSRGDLFFEHQKYSEAFADYAVLLELSIKNRDDAYFKMALCKYYLDDSVTACELYHKVDDPDDFNSFEELNKLCNK